MEKMKTVCLLVSVLLACSEAAKILVVFPLPSRSHGNLGDGYVRHLLKAGHKVTYITPFTYKNAPANLRTIDISNITNLLPQNMINLKSVMEEGTHDFSSGAIVFFMAEVVRHTAENEEVQKLLNDPKEEFDAVIVEWLFSDITAGFASVFQCPLIWSSSVDPHWQVLQLIDEPLNPSYAVDAQSQNFPPLNFYQRVNELWTQLKVQVLRYFWLDSVEEKAYTSIFSPIAAKRGIKLPTYDELRYNASLVLSNAYVTTSGGVSLPQSHKFIGGYHIDDTMIPLPEDLKKLMDSAKDGVIYFSMGSSLKSKDLPEKVRDNLLKMFGSLKQTVLWKFEEVLPNLPKNVHILEWAPQQAILAHPNLVVFITHGGLLSTTESIHFGVPIIGIPVFGDQYMNVEKSIKKGFAQKVDLAYTMSDELKKKIVEVISNKRYAEKVKELSSIYHDRPVTPGQELVHWVNHVINTRGAPHLRSPAVDLPFYKRKFLDLAAVITVLILAVYILLKRACAYIYSQIMEKMKTVCLLISVILVFSEAAKILVVFPMPSRSHANLGDGYVRHLLKAGHEVTYITPFPYKNAPANLRRIDVSNNSELVPHDMMSLKGIMDEGTFDVNSAFMIYFMVDIIRNTVENEGVQTLLNDPKEQFDAVIVEWMYNDAFAGFASVFQCPLIWSSSMDPHWQIIQLIDEPLNPAYAVDAMSLYFPPLDFLQRAKELWNQLLVQFLRFVLLSNIEEKAYTSIFTPVAAKRGVKLPTFDESRYNASLVLSNAYVTTSGGASLPQSHKFIGGYHIDDTVVPLPEDLKKLMDSAKDGVIYFSMGSNLRSKDLPDEVKVNLLKMFGSLKQTVLWKFEEVLPNLPKNVHILEWAPQQAILAHPNLAVFITHGGLLSTTESIHFGVPIIGIPVFGDQFMNVEKSVNKGFAQRVDLAYTMPEELKKKIVEITGNKRYAAKAKELSFIHHDRPIKPGQELVHWVNHVINTRGAPHLRSPALDLPFYKRKFLDLAALIAKMKNALNLLLLISVVLACTESAKILVVSPGSSKSHGILGDGYVRLLLNAGHEVTYITPYVYKNHSVNLRIVDTSSNFDQSPPILMDVKDIMDNKIGDMDSIGLTFMMSEIVQKTITHENVQKLLNDPKEQFDVVIVEWMFGDIGAGFASVFECPFIWSLTLDPHWNILKLIDEPSNPAYAVDIWSTYSAPLSFVQRVNELWNQLKIQFLKYVWLDGVEENMYTSLFKPILEKRGRKLPSFHEARYNASLVLSNAYVTTSGGAALPQSHKFVGGYHIDDAVEPLSEDLKKIMDNAKDGVIYFSMGTILRSKDLPEEVKNSLLKMFGSLKQTVLWKFEEILPNLPKNVHILQWAPQQAILAHPNLAVFITHGGLLSTIESIHFGVPIIAIPVFGDQFLNVERSVNKGFALKVDLSYTMSDELKKKIVEITTNKRYAEKAKELSFIHHDRPVKPGQELVHWVNHVINIRGAPHLRSPALDLPFYKRKYLDLAALIAVLLLIVYILLKRAIAYISSRVCSSKQNIGSKKKKNN
ncbi:hypothetical protein PYW08_008802 [Mythimna loreyi]|uniref:Uncharacterized protein n=1 Tax=Mythimna loreyi TaxID=667449 RepID=A0ACC2QDG6_9NEOP|nr:hypothetical protein PYW08_008802 [Mythimna loreyi]